MTVHPVNRFKANLGKGTQLGFFATLGSPSLTELIAGCGFDWVLIDTEHSPIELPDIIDHMRAIEGAGLPALVRPAWNDTVLIKRILDQGAQSLLIPYVENAEEAQNAVAAIRFPPRGVRGVSGASRSSNYGLAEGYFAKAEKELCLIVQIESTGALNNIERIAEVDGVDAVFIGPSDLAASMGHIGNAQHPDVQKAIDEGFARIRKTGKATGYLTGNEAEFMRRKEEGIDFISFATDAVFIRTSTLALTARLKGKA